MGGGTEIFVFFLVLFVQYKPGFLKGLIYIFIEKQPDLVHILKSGHGQRRKPPLFLLHRFHVRPLLKQVYRHWIASVEDWITITYILVRPWGFLNYTVGRISIFFISDSNDGRKSNFLPFCALLWYLAKVPLS